MATRRLRRGLGLGLLLMLAPVLLFAQDYAPALAVTVAPESVVLADILNGRARIGFDPVLARGVAYHARANEVMWLRLRVDLPKDGAESVLRLERQGFQSLRMYGGDQLVRPLAEMGPDSAPAARTWPDSDILPLPPTLHGEQTIYIRVQARGGGYLNLQPVVLTRDEWIKGERASASRYRSLYGGMLLLFLLALYRHWRVGRMQGAIVAVLACLLASAVGNDHFQFTVGGLTPQSGLGTTLPYALWIVACGPLMWAASLYAGHDKNRQDVAWLTTRLGWAALLAGVVLAVMTPAKFASILQVTALVSLLATILICLVALFFDPRQWRWGPILVCLALLPALAAVPLAYAQVLPATFLVRRGFEQLLALLLLLYVLLPWLRQSLQQRAISKRAVAPELSAEEKIALAREQMMAGLQSGLANADEDDLEWIAYRRLLEGLKPVLPQVASAVVAMNYHNEDLLLVEPRDALDRYRLLLQQRGSMLKRLSKVRAPQQVSLDFDGPEGPLAPVQLAMIPLPIESPGWGALLIERLDGVTYSDQELDLCAEFASLATTAGDEAAEAMSVRKSSEFDRETGVYLRETIDYMLARLHDSAMKQGQPLSLLLVMLDNCDELQGAELVAAMHVVADAIREEMDYGESVGRYARDQFMVLAPDRNMGEARDLAERIRAAVSNKQALAAHGKPLTVSLGISQQQQGERQLALLLERTALALKKAQFNGGDQAQAVATTTL